MTPDLDYLLVNYFHQDFNEEFGGVWQAVDALVRDEPDVARRVPAQVDEFLAAHTSEAEADAALSRLGCEYFARPEDGGYRGWLTSIAERIRRANQG